jgi:acyl dehydratase
MGRSGGVVVTQEMVDDHAATTGDAQWIHNDPDRATRESPFGGPVVQGFLLLSLMTQLSAGLSFTDVPSVSMMVNYGFDRVRFLAPVPVGAAVSMEATLVEVRPKPDHGAVLAVDVELHAEPGPSRPAVAARWLFLAVSR